MIRVTWLDGAATDTSGAFSIVAPSLTVAEPNTNVEWRIGETRTIRVNHNLGTGQQLNIQLSRNGGTTWTQVATVTTTGADAATTTWKVTAPATTHALIRVSWSTDPSVTDVSNQEFRIR
jgi:hypothetical protein